MNIDNIEYKVNKYRAMKNHIPRREAKFKCEQCSKTDYKIKDNIVISDCCKKLYSIDYLYLHTTPTYLHTR